jgi:subtilisin family serine protease
MHQERAPQGAEDTDGTALFYDYFDQQIPLAMVRSELAVRFADAHQSDRPFRENLLRELIPGWGIADRFGDWTLFSTQEASGTESLATGVDAVEAMHRIRSAHPRTYFLGPILRSGPEARILPGPEIIIRVEEGVDSTSADRLFASQGARIVQHPFGSNSRDYLIEVLGLDGFETLKVAARLYRRPEVHSTTPNFFTDGIRPARMPGSDCAALPPPGVNEDPTYGNNWNLHGTLGVDAPGAWAQCGGADTGGAPLVTVAVVGDGIELGHQDLRPDAQNLVEGKDFVPSGQVGTDGSPVTVCDNHETAVAGVIAMRANTFGSRGVAPKVKLYSARAHYQTTFGSSCGPPFNQVAWTVDAFDWVALDPLGPKARVVNYSWNWTGGQVAAVDNKLQDLRDADVVVFVSAGNSNQDSLRYPANLSTVIGVGALDRDLAAGGNPQRWVHPTITGFGSNYGPTLDLMAPGGVKASPAPSGGIWTSDRSGSAGHGSGNYVYEEGTSFAAPAAAAVAALMLAEAPILTADQVEQILCATAIDLGPPGRDDEFGCGLVDAATAVEAASAMLFHDDFETGDTQQWTITKQ